MKLLGLIATTMVALTACGLPTARDLYGSGPVPNRTYIERGYREYLQTMTPGYFFVSENGAYGYSYCAASTCTGMEMRVAQDSCLRNSNGSKCWVYAKGRFVVWNESGSTPSNTQAVLNPPSPAPAPIATSPNVKSALPPINATEPETISRPIAIKWEGYPSLIAGTATIRAKGESGEMTMTLPNNDGRCTGSYRGTNQGTWSVACTNGLAASGTYQTRGTGLGSTGTGTDTKGRLVEFTVGGSS